nr:F-box/kelch-repeat protein At1g23390 [Ipomoea batatas]GMD98819.1 F-box/kelch-repeat protein At1g23390 [Ipomoea batatas]
MALTNDQIHGDILEVVLSYLPLVDLVPASVVSKSWNSAVTASLRWLNKPKPWLLVHTQSTRAPYEMSTRAYDHRSCAWVEVVNPAAKYVSALRSSHSNLLYMLSPTTFSFSIDALNVAWQHVDAPKVWRTDPIVAHVGGYIVVAGGTCDFEDDPLAVEIYNVGAGTWETCESMPAILKDSSASTWLSIATAAGKLIVTEKLTGATHCFDPETKNWTGPYDLRPDQRVSLSIIGSSENRLILVGAIGDIGNIEGIKIWEVNTDNFDYQEIGEMPAGFVKKLKSETFGISSIGLCMSGDYAHIYNASEAEEVVVCELDAAVGGGCEWRSFKNAVAGDGNNRMERVVLTSSEVSLAELRRAMGSEKVMFTVKM